MNGTSFESLPAGIKTVLDLLPKFARRFPGIQFPEPRLRL